MAEDRHARPAAFVLAEVVADDDPLCGVVAVDIGDAAEERLLGLAERARGEQRVPIDRGGDVPPRRGVVRPAREEVELEPLRRRRVHRAEGERPLKTGDARQRLERRRFGGDGMRALLYTRTGLVSYSRVAVGRASSSSCSCATR